MQNVSHELLLRNDSKEVAHLQIDHEVGSRVLILEKELVFLIKLLLLLNQLGNKFYRQQFL